MGAIQRSGFETERIAEEWIGGAGGALRSSSCSTSTSRTRPTARPSPTPASTPTAPTTARSPPPTRSLGKFFEFLKAQRPLRLRGNRRDVRPRGRARRSRRGRARPAALPRGPARAAGREAARGQARRRRRGRGRSAWWTCSRRSRRCSASTVRRGWPAPRCSTRLRRPARNPRAIYSETLFPRYHFGWSDLASLTNDRYQYIHGPRPELFDVVADPQERNGPRRRPASGLSDAARGTARAAPAPPGAGRLGSRAAQEARRARLHRRRGSPSENAENLPDPRDHIQEIRALRQAVLLQSAAAVRRGGRRSAGGPEAEPADGRRLGVARRGGAQAGSLSGGARSARAAGPAARRARRRSCFPSPTSTSSSVISRRPASTRERALVANAPPEAHEVLARIALSQRDWATAEREATLALEGHQGRKTAVPRPRAGSEGPRGSSRRAADARRACWSGWPVPDRGR